jgi:hypothetical protein
MFSWPVRINDVCRRQQDDWNPAATKKAIVFHLLMDIFAHSSSSFLAACH